MGTVRRFSLEDARECVVNSRVLLSRTCFIPVRPNSRIMKKLYIQKPILLSSDTDEASTSHQILGRDFEFSVLILGHEFISPDKTRASRPISGSIYLLAAIVQQ